MVLFIYMIGVFFTIIYLNTYEKAINRPQLQDLLVICILSFLGWWIILPFEIATYLGKSHARLDKNE